MYGLSDELTRDMTQWNEFWTSNFDPFDGWKSDTAREQWREEGVTIAARLRAEVSNFADVRYEPWPLGYQGRIAVDYRPSVLPARDDTLSVRQSVQRLVAAAVAVHEDRPSLFSMSTRVARGRCAVSRPA